MLLKIVFVVYLILLLDQMAMSDTAEDHPGKCWVEKENKAYSKGEKWASKGDDDSCLEFTCQGEGTFTALTCAPFSGPPGTTISKQDNTKPFPMCCPQLVEDV